MAGGIVRAAVVGASTLLGKELAEELKRANDVVWDITLLDVPETGGQIAAAGDEALVIQSVSVEAFAHVDVAFFAGEPASTLEFWKVAHGAGAIIVDLTGALEGHAGVIVRSPLVKGGVGPDLKTVAIISAHPVAVMLGLVSSTLEPIGLAKMAATVLLPASELGSPGVEEMQQQTVGLLTFKPLKKELYDAQVAFNLLASLGASSKVTLEGIGKRINDHLRALVGTEDFSLVIPQLIQAPVFHGYTASVFLQFQAPITEKSIAGALYDAGFAVVDRPTPSNESCAGKEEILFRVMPAESAQGKESWLWMAADNLRLAAKNAVACAGELIDLRPSRSVN